MLRVHLCGGARVEVDGHFLPDALLTGRQGRLGGQDDLLRADLTRLASANA